MAEDHLSVLWRYGKLLKQRRGGVAQCVNADTADAVVIADSGEGPDEVARLDRTPCLGGEDQACVGPRRAETFAVALLSLAAVGQCMSSQPEKRAGECRAEAARSGGDTRRRWRGSLARCR